MTERQPSNSEKSSDRISWGGRLAALGVAGMITAGFGILWAAEHQWIRLGPLLGVCGFKQRTGLPCPGCGWTHTAQAFVTGRIKEAFCLQPAAAVFCLAAAVIVLFALQITLLGVDSAPLRWARSPGGIKILIIAAVVVILGGWLVTLAQAIMESGGS
jgi:hypothetical protein